MSRGRKAIAVNAVDLQNTITNIETGSNPPSSRQKLWEAVASTDWAKGLTLSSQVAMLKAKALGCIIATPLGKKGNPGGLKKTRTGGTPRKGIPATIAAELKRIHGEKYSGTVDRASKGSLKSAIKLKCLDCCGFQKSEVALCTITACPLWSFRFVKNPLTLTEEGRKEINEKLQSGQDV